MQSGGEKMAHVKIARDGDIQKKLFQAWVREAVHLNHARGDLTKNK